MNWFGKWNPISNFSSAIFYAFTLFFVVSRSFLFWCYVTRYKLNAITYKLCVYLCIDTMTFGWGGELVIADFGDFSPLGPYPNQIKLIFASFSNCSFRYCYVSSNLHRFPSLNKRFDRTAVVVQWNKTLVVNLFSIPHLNWMLHKAHTHTHTQTTHRAQYSRHILCTSFQYIVKY